MKAMERIKEIEKRLYSPDSDKVFLLKVFHVMREIAIKNAEHYAAAMNINREFEERMAEKD